MIEPGTISATTAARDEARPRRILILGIGKSGTTALMAAICKATGLPHEMEPRDLGELDYTKSFVAKKLIDTFGNRELKFISRFDKVILIVRDPRDALVSRVLYRAYGLSAFNDDAKLKRFLDLIDQKIADPKSVNVMRLIACLRELSQHQLINSVKDVNERLLAIHKAHGSRALLLKYEDFVRNDYTAIDAYLGTSISDGFAVPQEYGRVSRKGGQGDWKNWLTAADCAYFDKLFVPIYTTFGYEPEMPSDRPVIDRATSADYIIDLANEWRARRGIAPYGSGRVERPAELVMPPKTGSGVPRWLRRPLKRGVKAGRFGRDLVRRLFST